MNDSSPFFFTEEYLSEETYHVFSSNKISKMIKEKAKADVSPSQIILKDELNKVGLFKVEINFHSEVKTNISIKIDKIKSK